MRVSVPIPAVVAALVAACAGCGSQGDATSGSEAGIPLGGDADAAFAPVEPPDQDASKPKVDGGFPVADAGVLAVDRFVTKVVSFVPGDCAGFGAAQMPDIVLGPPIGAGDDRGGLDVVSLGNGGTIVLSFEPNAIVDGPGPDFIVFENAFYAAGNPSHPAAEVGEVSVSDDGVAWTTFPCTATSFPYGACAGWHPVYSAPDNGISPVDPNTAGGDAFDLKDLGVTHARYVRIVDKAGKTCPTTTPRPNTNGFDLDAVSIVNAEHP